MERENSGLNVPKFDRTKSRFGNSPTPRKTVTPHRGFTKPAFNFKKAKKAKKAADKSRRINRK